MIFEWWDECIAITLEDWNKLAETIRPDSVLCATNRVEIFDEEWVHTQSVCHPRSVTDALRLSQHA